MIVPLFPSSSFQLSLPLYPIFACRACSSLAFHVSTGPPSLPLICKVSTPLCCICVLQFVVIENLFLIRCTLVSCAATLGPRLALDPRQRVYPGFNCFKRLADLPFVLAPFFASFYLPVSRPVFLSSVSASIPTHSLLFLPALQGSDTNGGISG